MVAVGLPALVKIKFLHLILDLVNCLDILVNQFALFEGGSHVSAIRLAYGAIESILAGTGLLHLLIWSLLKDLLDIRFNLLLVIAIMQIRVRQVAASAISLGVPLASLHHLDRGLHLISIDLLPLLHVSGAIHVLLVRVFKDLVSGKAR